jgi:ketosteroid isomerase-like protein
MTSEDMKQLAKQAYALFMAGDIQKMMDNHYADDIEWVGTESEYIPFSGTYHGKAEVAQFFMKMAECQEAQRFEITEYLADGDKVVVYGTSRWRVKSTGKTYDNPWVHISTIRDGKTVRFEQYNNTAAAVEAFLPATSSMNQQKDTVSRH